MAMTVFATLLGQALLIESLVIVGGWLLCGLALASLTLRAESDG